MYSTQSSGWLRFQSQKPTAKANLVASGYGVWASTRLTSSLQRSLWGKISLFSTGLDFNKATSISALLWGSSCQWQTMNTVGTHHSWLRIPLSSTGTMPGVDHQSYLCKSPSSIILLIFNSLLPSPSSSQSFSNWTILQHNIANSSLGLSSDQETFTLCWPASLHLSCSSPLAWLQPRVQT